MNHATTKTVADVIADILGLEPDDISAESDLSDLGADQLAMTDIVTELEQRLKIELPTDMEDARTVADLAEGVRAAWRDRSERDWSDYPGDAA